MNQLISHIELLLHEHNCVIIPGFGGFVVNTIPPQKDGVATFLAPVCELVFNRDLIHNDGLLAQSYMKSGGISFETAMLRISQEVQTLKLQMREQRHVDMGKLGAFDLHDDNRFVYTPRSFVRPALFGLKQATLKPLIQIQPVISRKEDQRKQKWIRNVGVAAATVASIILFMFVFPTSDSTGIAVRQSARMISETGWWPLKSTQPTEDVVVENQTVNVGENEILPNVDLASQNEMPDNSPKYYIIMGVYKGMESAKKTTELLLDEGFHQTGLLERPDRIDVYAASFTDKTAAEVYLREVHKKFPTHLDAWILKR